MTTLPSDWGPRITRPVRKVLLADDEPQVLSLLQMTLEDSDQYRLLLARDGEEALAICQAEHPAMAFLDIQMPKIDGVEVCRQYRLDPLSKQTTIIMLTGSITSDDEARAVAAGADRFLTKPFSPTALLELVNQVIDEADSAA